MIEQHSRSLALAVSAADAWSIFKSGRIASFIGVEGLYQIQGSASVLRNLYRLGVRYVTLTYDSNNLYADAVNAVHRAHGGLSEQGVDIISEMNRIGMIIDLSHTSVPTQRHVLRLSQAPVIFSHSSCSKVQEHPRNSPDEILYFLQSNGGVFMISFLRKLTDAIEPSLKRVADHIEHVGNLIGWQHVGLGSDFDGMLEGPARLEDVSRFLALISELLRRGVAHDSIRSLMGGNILRVLSSVEGVATELKEKRTA